MAGQLNALVISELFTAPYLSQHPSEGWWGSFERAEEQFWETFSMS